MMALKSNRTVALSKEEKPQGKFIRIDSRIRSEQSPVKAWLKGHEFPVLLHRQVFTNSGATPRLFKTLGNAHQDKDGSSGILYLVESDLTCNASKIETIYQKRWKVEVFHKTLKSNTGLAKSPTKSTRTQTNHIFMSIYAAFQLECLSLKHKMNHFALRSRIYI